jgi:hypothetical protein
MKTYQMSYQFNGSMSSYISPHKQTYQILRNTKKIKSWHYSTAPWQCPPPPPHHLNHGVYHCNAGYAVIALIATSPATILPLGLVRFAAFPENLRHFHHAIFVTWWPSWPGGRKWEFIDCKFIFTVSIPWFHYLHHRLIGAFIAVHFCLSWARCSVGFVWWYVRWQVKLKFNNQPECDRVWRVWARNGQLELW